MNNKIFKCKIISFDEELEAFLIEKNENHKLYI